MTLELDTRWESSSLSTRRLPPHTPIAVVDSVSGRELGRLGNISSTGLMFVAADGFQFRRVYAIRLLIVPSQDPLNLRVEIVWSKVCADGELAVGACIKEISSEGRSRLHDYLRELNRHRVPRAEGTFGAARPLPAP